MFSLDSLGHRMEKMRTRIVELPHQLVHTLEIFHRQVPAGNRETTVLIAITHRLPDVQPFDGRIVVVLQLQHIVLYGLFRADRVHAPLLKIIVDEVHHLPDGESPCFLQAAVNQHQPQTIVLIVHFC